MIVQFQKFAKKIPNFEICVDVSLFHAYISITFRNLE